MNDAEAQATLEKVREKLAEFQRVADLALLQAQAALSGGGTLGRSEVKALNRAASLSRYVTDCANQALYEPPKRKRRTGNPMLELWQEPATPTESLERRAVELIRLTPLFDDAESALERLAGHWCKDVRAWLEEDAAASGRTVTAEQSSGRRRSESKGEEATGSSLIAHGFSRRHAQFVTDIVQGATPRESSKPPHLWDNPAVASDGEGPERKSASPKRE